MIQKNVMDTDFENYSHSDNTQIHKNTKKLKLSDVVVTVRL